MKTYLLATVLLCGLAAPAFAANPYYVMFNKKTKTCFIARSAPTETEKFSMMGTYGSEKAAKKAMAGMSRCR